MSEVVHTFEYFENSALHLSSVCVRGCFLLRDSLASQDPLTPLYHRSYITDTDSSYMTKPNRANQSKQNQGKPSPSSEPDQSSHGPRGVSQGGAKRVLHLPGVTSLTGCYTTECHTTYSVLHLQGPQYLDVGRMIMRRITGGHCGSCYSRATFRAHSLVNPLLLISKFVLLFPTYNHTSEFCLDLNF